MQISELLSELFAKQSSVKHDKVLQKALICFDKGARQVGPTVRPTPIVLLPVPVEANTGLLFSAPTVIKGSNLQGQAFLTTLA